MVFSTEKPVHLQGYASDYDRAITAIEFSLDGGEHWTRYKTEHTTSEKWVVWDFEYHPKKSGTYQLLVRSVNDRDEVSPTPSVIQFEVRDEL